MTSKLNVPFILLLSLLLMLSSCVNDNLDGQVCPDNSQGTKIPLSIGDMPVIETRSVASTNERMIDDAYVLVFGPDGNYKDGERINKPIENNGQPNPTLTTNLLITSGKDDVVVLCNTGVTEMPTTLTTTSTTADINTAFPSVGWSINRSDTNSGKGMPMSGIIKGWVNGKEECQMYRSVAKIQLLLNIPSGADKTSSFTTATGAVKWGMYNQVQEGNIFSSEDDISTPSTVTFANDAALAQRVVGASGATAAQQTYYMPEYPNATKAQKLAVSASTFHKDRSCLIVQTSAGFYRLDIAKGNTQNETKNFLDINRNYHYKVTITKVKSSGYESAGEALANPSSNLEYEVVITGDDDNFTTSDGQYAVTTDKRYIAISGSVTTPEDLVKFRCEANGVAKIDICTVRLVGEDKKKLIPTTQFQMRKSDGTVIANNEGELTSTDGAGYQLKFTSPDEDSLPPEQCYVEICYGNIRHYVPVNIYVFIITAPESFSYKGDEHRFDVISYKAVSPKNAQNVTAVRWTAKEFSVDGGVTWTTRPAWVSKFDDNGPGSTDGTASTYHATIAIQTKVTNPQSDALKAATPLRGTYDLSTNGGSTIKNTANCYVINRAGTYSLPLVYGNAIKDGALNSEAFTGPTSTGDGTPLVSFFSAKGTIPSDGKIKDADGAKLIWQDAENLVTAVALTSNKDNLTFTVDKATIQQGNAVVAVTNGDGEVLWSWHIWVTDYNPFLDAPLSFVSSNGITYKFMPVNIGWCNGPTYPARSVKVRLTQNESGIQKEMDLNQLAGEGFGNSPYFQWGRKDPFVGGLHTNKSKTWYDTAGGAAKIDINPATNNTWGASTSGAAKAEEVIHKGILNPGTFCSNTSMDTYYVNLWSAKNKDYSSSSIARVIKSVYDPSPVGYHMPAKDAFSGFTSGDNGTGTWDWETASWTFVKSGSDNITLFSLGCRVAANANVRNFSPNIGIYYEGNYWMAETTGKGDGLRFRATTIGVLPSSESRGYGFSVRCVADD